MTKTTATVARIPNCDICPPDAKKPAIVDAKSRNGQWGYMCETCWPIASAYPVGPNNEPALGTGIGQRLILAT